MSTTIHDVARASGVSIATVSRALAGSRVVAVSTRQRVQQVAEELHYVPNRAARQLVTGQGQSIGLVLPDLENPFYASVAKGMQQRVRARGMSAIIADTDELIDTERAVLSQLSVGADRLILASPRVDDDYLRALSTKVRLVLINRDVPASLIGGDITSVVPDNADGVAQALRHLRNLGHRRIGYAGGPSAAWSDVQRRGAWRRDDSGVQVVDLGSYRPGHSGGLAAADEAVAEGVSAVLAFNDQLAIGILARLGARGIRVPSDMSVVGFDDVPIARQLSPALTTVRMAAKEMGATAVDLLMESGPSVVVPVDLQVRDSTDEPKG